MFITSCYADRRPACVLQRQRVDEPAGSERDMVRKMLDKTDWNVTKSALAVGPEPRHAALPDRNSAWRARTSASGERSGWARLGLATRQGSDRCLQAGQHACRDSGTSWFTANAVFGDRRCE